MRRALAVARRSRCALAAGRARRAAAPTRCWRARRRSAARRSSARPASVVLRFERARGGRLRRRAGVRRRGRAGRGGRAVPPRRRGERGGGRAARRPAATAATRRPTASISADSHPVSGGFVFAVGAGAAPAATVDELLAGEDAGPVTSRRLRRRARASQYGAIARRHRGARAAPARAGCRRCAPPSVRRRARGRLGGGVGAFARRAARLLAGGAAIAGALAALAALVLQAATAGGHARRGPRSADVDATCSRRASASSGARRCSPGSPSVALARARGPPPCRRCGRRRSARPASRSRRPRPVDRRARRPARSRWRSCPGSAGTPARRRRWRCCCPPTCCTCSPRAPGSAASPCSCSALPAATARGSTPADAHAPARRRRAALLDARAAPRSRCCCLGGIVQSLLQLDRRRRARRHRLRPRGADQGRRSFAVLVALGAAATAARILPALRARRRAGDAARAAPASLLRRTLRAELALGGRRARGHRRAGRLPAGRRRGRRARSPADAALGPARAELTVEPARAGRQRDPPLPVRPPRRPPVRRAQGAARRGRAARAAASRPIELDGRARPAPATTSSPAPRCRRRRLAARGRRPRHRSSTSSAPRSRSRSE